MAIRGHALGDVPGEAGQVLLSTSAPRYEPSFPNSLSSRELQLLLELTGCLKHYRLSHARNGKLCHLQRQKRICQRAEHGSSGNTGGTFPSVIDARQLELTV